MTITLYRREGSGSAACEALLALTGHDCAIVDVVKEPDGSAPASYRALNPLGQVPALVTEDGSVITESAAVMIWLADTAPKGRLAPDLTDPDRAPYLRVMAFFSANLYPAYLRLFYAERYTSDPDGAGAVQHAALKELARGWEIAAHLLADKPYYAGGALTAADLYAAMFTLWRTEDEPPLAASVAAHAERVLADPRLKDSWDRNR